MDGTVQSLRQQSGEPFAGCEAFAGWGSGEAVIDVASLTRRAVASVDELIDEARNGRIVALVDGFGESASADFVLPAQFATPRAINFMAKWGRGLICLALERRRVEELGLPMMKRRHAGPSQKAFTVSIEAREGVATGISVHDRARTIAVAIDGTREPDDLVSPGHVFPLVAHDGGVLERPGHTEASVDLARLAGLNPAGVHCKVLAVDGSVASVGDVHRLSAIHGFLVGSTSDLSEYLRAREPIWSPAAGAEMRQSFRSGERHPGQNIITNANTGRTK